MEKTSNPYQYYAFLDRDGTIIIDKVYLSTPEGIDFADGVIEGLKLLRDNGFGLIIITNQSGIGRGYFDVFQLDQIHKELLERLRQHGIDILKIYYCPHKPNDNCSCRKPMPGMINDALLDFDIDRVRAVFIGDSDADMGAARAAGIMGIKIDKNNKISHENYEMVFDFYAAATKTMSLLKLH